MEQLAAASDVTLFLNFFPHRRETIQEQLTEVGQGDGVAAGDTLASKLLDEIAEEEVYGVGASNESGEA